MNNGGDQFVLISLRMLLSMKKFTNEAPNVLKSVRIYIPKDFNSNMVKM